MPEPLAGIERNPVPFPVVRIPGKQDAALDAPAHEAHVVERIRSPAELAGAREDDDAEREETPRDERGIFCPIAGSHSNVREMRARERGARRELKSRRYETPGMKPAQTATETENEPASEDPAHASSGIEASPENERAQRSPGNDEKREKSERDPQPSRARRCARTPQRTTGR